MAIGKIPQPGAGNRHTAETEALVCKYHTKGLTQGQIAQRVKKETGVTITRATISKIVRRAEPYHKAISHAVGKPLAEGESITAEMLIALLYDRAQYGWSHLTEKEQRSPSMYRLHINLVVGLLDKIDPGSKKPSNSEDLRKALMARLGVVQGGGGGAEVAPTQSTDLN